MPCPAVLPYVLCDTSIPYQERNPSVTMPNDIGSTVNPHTRSYDTNTQAHQGMHFSQVCTYIHTGLEGSRLGLPSPPAADFLYKVGALGSYHL